MAGGRGGGRRFFAGMFLVGKGAGGSAGGRGGGDGRGRGR